MIRVYYLPVDRMDNTDIPRGAGIINTSMSKRIMECTEEPNVRKLIMDTTTAEDVALRAIAIKSEDATPKNIQRLEFLPEIEPPQPSQLDLLEARIAELEKLQGG